MGEKTQAVSFTAVIIGCLILLSVVGTAIHFGSRVVGTELDHQVLTHSHSYQEARRSEMATYEAELANLEKEYDLAPDEETRQQITIQIKAAEKQLAIARSLQ